MLKREDGTQKVRAVVDLSKGVNALNALRATGDQGVIAPSEVPSARMLRREFGGKIERAARQRMLAQRSVDPSSLQLVSRPLSEFTVPGWRQRAMRAQLRKSVVVDKIVWSYHDYGYGNSLAHVGRETVNWLRAQGMPVKILPWGPNVTPSMTVPRAMPGDLATSAVIVMARVPVAGQVHRWLSDGRCPFVAAYYMTEGSKATDSAVEMLKAYDAVFTPTEFCRRSLLDAGLTVPVFVWGHGFDHTVFPYVEPKADRPFTFLWFGDENRRKGYDLFLKAFKEVDVPNVRAWVRGPGKGGIRYIRKHYEHDKRIVWDTGVKPAGNLTQMMAEVDVLVHPLRGEGFCLPILEGMAAGRPAICTRWSGPLDFAGGDDLTYWIEVDGWESAQNDSGVQAIPDMEQLVETMKYCATHPKEVRARGKAASVHAHESWRWEQKVLDVIPAIRQMVPNCKLDLPGVAITA